MFGTLTVEVTIFFLIVLASSRIGKYFTKLHLPLITGFMATGMIVGPHILNLITTSATTNLKFIDEISLAFIAFAAGGELYLNDVRKSFKSIKWLTIFLIFVTFHLGGLVIFFLTDYIPIIKELPIYGKIAVSILGGSILVARSPSSAIALIRELRAKGTFTQTVLGVTVIMDVAVIILYSINTSIADALTSNITFSFNFVFLLLGELLVSSLLGYLVGKLYQAIFFVNMSEKIKGGLVLIIGFGVFVLADFIKHYTLYNFLFEVSLEPLLICMLAAFYLSNFSIYRDNVKSIIYKIGPTVYLAFFTLTGASLDINILPLVWDMALIIFFTRLLSIIIGSVIGGTIARTPINHTKVSWMAFITQAGVGLGLAKGIAYNYPTWGSTFATIIISVIVINQIVGPIMFKFSLFFVKEAHPEAKKSEHGEIHSALIIGIDGTSITLAEQLAAHDWKVIMATNRPIDTQLPKQERIRVHQMDDLSLRSLKEADGKEVGTIITMLSDENNFHLCELAFENFPNCKLVVYLKSRSNFERFKIFNASIVSSSTATISLLDHYVRSPSAVSLLLGLEDGQDIIDITISNPHLFGLPMRDLRLPENVTIVTMHRGRHSITVQGHTRFKVGDQLTVKGCSDSLQEITRIFTK